MNRKRMAAALLLCLTLLCGCARADWADDTADALCARMTALGSGHMWRCSPAARS